MNLQKKLEQIENELTESQQELERVNEQLDEKEKAFANVSLIFENNLNSIPIRRSDLWINN